MTAVLGASAGDGSRLIQAVRDQNVALARQLVADGVDVNAVQGDGASALHWAAHRGDLKRVQSFVQFATDADLWGRQVVFRYRAPLLATAVDS